MLIVYIMSVYCELYLENVQYETTMIRALNCLKCHRNILISDTAQIRFFLKVTIRIADTYQVSILWRYDTYRIDTL